jgi:hypothetical protein
VVNGQKQAVSLQHSAGEKPRVRSDGFLPGLTADDELPAPHKRAQSD